MEARAAPIVEPPPTVKLLPVEGGLFVPFAEWEKLGKYVGYLAEDYPKLCAGELERQADWHRGMVAEMKELPTYEESDDIWIAIAATLGVVVGVVGGALAFR